MVCPDPLERPRRVIRTMPTTSLHDDLRRFRDGGHLPESGGAGAPQGVSERDLVRLGRSVSLDVRRTLGLVIKRQWETFPPDREASDASRGLPAVPSRARGRWREFHVGAGQAPDARRLFDLFEAEGRYATGSGYDREAFESLVHQFVLLGLHRLSIHGPEMDAFVAAQEAQVALLGAASSSEREEYWLKHCHWRELEDEVGTLLLDLETRALDNERVQQQWMETFGTAYLALLEAEARCGSLERSIRRKTDQPGLTAEELDRLEAAGRREQEREVARLRRHLARARAGGVSGPGGMPPEAAELWAYEEDCKRLLREIYRLTHPDALGRHGFTEDQKELLVACYREAVACGSPSAVDDDEVALGVRSLESLEAILGRARKVWQSMGLAWNEEAAICGETLAERIAWLETRIAELEAEARDVQADLLAVATDPDVHEKRASMSSPSVVARVAAEMEERAASLAERASELESQLQGLFQARGRA